MQNSIRLGRIAGIQIGIHYSWFIVFVLVLATLSIFFFPVQYPGFSTAAYWVMGVATTLLFFASVLIHELSHSLVATAKGIPVQSITLFIFGGVSQISREADDPRTELLVALAGPLSSIGVGIVFGAVWFLSAGVSLPVAAVTSYLAIINIFLAIFNLIPGFPLDGGRVLRAIVWSVTNSQRRAMRVAVTSGRIVSYLFILGGVFYALVLGNLLGGIWIAFIGWFLNNAASGSYRQAALQDILKDSEVEEVMSRDFEAIPPQMTVQELVEDHVLKHGLRAFPVVADSSFVGLITLSDIKNVPREQWDVVTVGDSMTRREKLRLAHPQENMNTVVSLMDNANINQIPVTDNGHIVGLLRRSDVVRFFAVRKELGLEEEESVGEMAEGI